MTLPTRPPALLLSLLMFGCGSDSGGLIAPPAPEPYRSVVVAPDGEEYIVEINSSVLDGELLLGFGNIYVANVLSPGCVTATNFAWGMLFGPDGATFSDDFEYNYASTRATRGGTLTVIEQSSNAWEFVIEGGRDCSIGDEASCVPQPGPLRVRIEGEILISGQPVGATPSTVAFDPNSGQPLCEAFAPAHADTGTP